MVGQVRPAAQLARPSAARRHLKLGRLVLAAVLAAGALSLSAAAGPAPSPCTPAVAAYTQLAADPAGLRARLAPYYEVGLEAVTYGPATTLPVPWDAVAAWAAARPAATIEHCLQQDGWRFAALAVPGGYAYVQLTPNGQLSKLYLSTEPLPWD